MPFPYTVHTTGARYELRAGSCRAPYQVRMREREKHPQWGHESYKFFFHEQCEGWRGIGTRIEYSVHTIIICRCRECDHPPFDLEEWKALPGVQSMFDGSLDTYRANKAHQRLMDFKDYLDPTVETMKTASELLNNGELEEAQQVIDHMLKILAEKTLDDPSYPGIRKSDDDRAKKSF